MTPCWVCDFQMLHEQTSASCQPSQWQMEDVFLWPRLFAISCYLTDHLRTRLWYRQSTFIFIFDSLLFHLVWENYLWSAVALAELLEESRVCVRRKDSHLVLLVCWIKKFQSYSVISNTHMEKTLFFTNLLLVILLKIKISRSENSSLFALISV